MNSTEQASLRRAAQAGACLIVAYLTSACFSYVPVSPAAVPPDEEVRVRVTEQAAVRVAPDLGIFRNTVEGRLVPVGEDSLSLSVWLGRDYPGTEFENVRRAVVLEREEVLEVRQRRLSPVRTGIAAAGVVALFAVLIDRIILQEDPNTGDGTLPPPPPPETLRIPIGWPF